MTMMIKKPLSREDRARKMVLDKSTWPREGLCMKKTDVQPPQFGVIFCAKPHHIELENYPGEPKFLTIFESIDDLIDAGWRVD